MSDPVKTGLVASLARPGGNLTGVSAQSFDIVPKQLELAKELVPGIKRICIMFDEHGDPDMRTFVRSELPTVAARAGASVCPIPVASFRDIQAARRIIRRQRPQAMMVWATSLITQYREAIVHDVVKGIPVFSEGLELAKAGALFTYSVDDHYLFERSAVYIDKILKGAKPGDLPIEQPTKFILVINLKTAERLSIRVPDSILSRADQIIR